MDSLKSESIKDTVTVLINAAGDSENSVNNVVIKSLTKIANCYPNEVIIVFCDYYKNTSKPSPLQLGNVIKVLEQTCVNQVKRLDSKVSEELVTSMLKAMTENVAYEPPVQLGASAVLVAVGHEYLDLVLRSLINQLSPASVPHYTIAHTLGTLAAVNTHGVVPHIKEILSKMLPLLPLVKHDGLKQAFAYAFGHFAIAVSEQIGDNVQNDNITSIKENFVTEFTIIFDILYNQWLTTNEPKVSESVLEALGPITRLISERQFNDTVNKFVVSLLSLYRKPTINFYYISQCISYLLSPSPLNPKLSLNDNVISNINHVLFNLVLLEPDYDQPHTVKNHFEVLRCFDHMANQFSDQTIESLLHQCKNNQEKERMKAVIILTHLTTSSQVFVDNYAAKFVAILKVMTAMEQGLKMKKLLVKAIVGLVYRNCITTPEEFAMVEFIIKHCSCEATANTSKHEVADLKDTCKSSLALMCNTVTSVRLQLRNLLLSALTVDEFTGSMGTVSHCVTSLLQNNSEVIDGDQLIKDVDTKVNPDLVFVRCLTHIVNPEEKEKNRNLLIFLEEYSGDVHKNLKNSWTIEIQRLLKFVDKNESKEQWHNMLLDLVVSAVDQINNSKWVEVIGTLLSQQVLAKKQSPMVKGVSLQYMALLSCHMTNAAVVEKILKIILLALKSIPMESCEYVSKAVGIAARQHGESVMNEIDAIYKENESRRGSKLLNFLSSRNSKSEQEYGIVKYAVITCYGKVAYECLDVHVLARLGENITPILYDILKSSPTFDLCKASVTTLYEISKALHPAAHHNVTLRNRWQLLNAVLEQIYNSNLEKRNVELYPIIVKASKALTKLQKGILPEERNTILRVLFNSIFGELSSFKHKYEIEGNGDKNDQLAKTLNDSLTLLHQLIRELIIQSTCLSTIDDLIGLLIEWIRHDNEEIRTAAVMILQVIFETYIKNVRLNFETPSKFGQMGYLLGLIVPGIADTSFPVRLTTIDCIKLIIQIQYLYEGHTTEPDDDCLTNLTHLQNNILTNDLNMISDYCMYLCDTIAPKIPHHHTMQYIESLLDGYDNLEYRSVGICSVLDAFIINKGSDLYQNVERIVELFLSTLEEVNEDSRLKLMKPLTSLTRHHSNAVTAVLLSQKLPLSQCAVLCWKHLAMDETLAPAIIDNFLRLMTSVELFEDPYHVTENHVAALQPLTLISALGEMLQVPTMNSICKDKFPDLFTVLYTTLVCYIEAEPPAYAPAANKTQERFGFVPNRESIKMSPSKITMDTFNVFLDRSNCHKVREACGPCVSGEMSAAEVAGVVCGAVCAHGAGAAPRLVPALAACARAALPPQRLAAVALLADMLNYGCNDNPIIVETILTTLDAGWKDSCGRVRAAALRGAGGVGRVAGRRAGMRNGAVGRAVAALSEGVDHSYTRSPADNVPLAALQGLISLLTETELDEEFNRELLAISQKIRPFMNTECPLMREHSIRLFGVIAERVRAESLAEQAVGSIPCFLLHLCDSNASVVRASKFTLKRIFKTFNVKKSNDLVQTHLVDEGRLYIEEFLAALLRQLADELPASVAECLRSAVNYLHCSNDVLKPYAPLLLGLLYAELHRIKDKYPEETELEDDVTRTARTRLLQLIKDSNPQVRQNAAMALSNICLVTASENRG